MKTNIILASLLAAGTTHAANLALTASNPITTTITVGAGDSWEQNGDFTISSTGFLDQGVSGANGRFRIGVGNTSTLTIDGGRLDTSTSETFLLGNGNNASGTIDLVSGILNLNPGIFHIGRDRSTGLVRIQGGVATFGSKPLFDQLGSSAGTSGSGSIDFTTASTGTLTIAGADKAYYEGLYAGTDLTFQSANTAAFDDVFSVTGSTITVVPEPSSSALIGLGGLALILRRRR